ncbi:uroporphyrinogen-III synthase [Rhizina undulata]
MPTPLILLKTKNSPTDPYETHFTTHPFVPSTGDPVPFNPIYVPVLQHRHINLSLLEEIITTNRIRAIYSEPNSRLESEEGGIVYGGLIITSQRAVEALGSVLSKLSSNPSLSTTLNTLLSQVKVYVVGPATAAAVTALGFTPTNVLGSSCGSGAVLAPFILADYNSSSSDTPKKLPLLFLVGEVRRDIIPKTLRSAPEPERIELTEMVIYETAVVEEFRDEFRAAMEKTAGAGERWVVVFSPAGADVAVEILREGGGEAEGVRIAAIGPTTEGVLKGLGRAPDVVAQKPSAEGLWEAIGGFMGREYK